jgi:hypothetical protein
LLSANVVHAADQPRVIGQLVAGRVRVARTIQLARRTAPFATHAPDTGVIGVPTVKITAETTAASFTGCAYCSTGAFTTGEPLSAIGISLTGITSRLLKVYTISGGRLVEGFTAKKKAGESE